MRMTDEEIVRDYRESKAPFKQIGILADLNACTRQAIADVLIRAGVEVPERYTRKALKLDEPAPEAAPEEAATEIEMITEPEAEPDDDTPDGVLPLRDVLPMIAERAAIASIGRALDDLDEIANDVSDVGRFAIIFAERVRGILMMFEDIKERCGQ